MRGLLSALVIYSPKITAAIPPPASDSTGTVVTVIAETIKLLAQHI